MTKADLIIIVCLGISAIYSLMKGMTREIFSLVAIFSGYLAANYYTRAFSIFLNRFFSNEKISTFLGFFLIFISVSIVIGILGRIVKKILHFSHALTLLDSIGGGIIGLLKGILIVTMLLVPINMIPFLKERLFKNSKIVHYFLSSSKYLSLLPTNKFNTLGNRKTKEIINGLKNNLKKSLKQFDISPDPKGHIIDIDKKELNKIISESLRENKKSP